MKLSGSIRSRGGDRRVSVPANWDQGRVCLTVYQVAFLLGEAVSSVWRQTKTNPLFPRPRELSGRRAVWFSDEVAVWLAESPKTFGKSEAFRDAVWDALAVRKYRDDLLAFCLRTGVITRERMEQHLKMLEGRSVRLFG